MLAQATVATHMTARVRTVSIEKPVTERTTRRIGTTNRINMNPFRAALSDASTVRSSRRLAPYIKNPTRTIGPIKSGTIFSGLGGQVPPGIITLEMINPNKKLTGIMRINTTMVLFDRCSNSFSNRGSPHSMCDNH